MYIVQPTLARFGLPVGNVKLNTGSNKYVHNLICVFVYIQSSRKALSTDNVGTNFLMQLYVS